ASGSSGQEPAAGSFDSSGGADYDVRRGDTLWRIAERVRPDARLSMNQTMLAIYQANPQAFAGNINVLRANSRLQIPSADEIFRITRGAALSEIRRQNQSWRGETPASSQTTLTLVQPDANQPAFQGGTAADAAAAPGSAAGGADQSRIRDLESRVAEQESLLEIRDSELARLRSELQRLRQERAAAGAGGDQPAAMPGDEPDTEVVDGIFVDDGQATTESADEPAAVEPPAPAAQATTPAPTVAAAPRPRDKGIVGTVLEFLTSIWGLLILALAVVVGILMWFARRASGTGGDAEDTGTWESLRDDDDEAVASTERLRALARDDDTSIVVVEQSAGGDTIASDSVNIAGLGAAAGFDLDGPKDAPTVSLEDTFSSETAINLDQSDPVAEADFHMAYGLYDQAADLINGALAIEPDRTDLMAKLCEIYFVWGNRDAFVSSANNLKSALGSDSGGDWDKVVIMGQQLAPDEAMFANASRGASAQSVDLDFAGDGGNAGGLDIDFAGDDHGESNVIDLGAEDISAAGSADDDFLDFSFDDDDSVDASATREMPRDPDKENTVESPTIEQTMSGLDSTAELPIASNDLEARLNSLDDGRGDETAEIDLDDLGLDLETLRGEVSGSDEDLLESTNEAMPDFSDDLAETMESERLESARTGHYSGKPDDDLLDATGQTQVLTEEFGKEFEADNEDGIGDSDATLLAPGLGSSDRPDFDFASTEALPRDAFDDSLDKTAETPAFTSTEMDLDLDDLTAALKVSEAGDTVEQQRDDETVEQRRMGRDDDLDLDFELGGGDVTQEIGPGGVSDELREARTMTEVGTKLDLARAYVDMGDPSGARNILEEVLEEGDEAQRQQAQNLLNSLPS
ncbi:MAG: FimV/HubP family polar landmark protein, partial [Woeseia sp.]